MAQAKLAWELLAKAVGNYTGKGVNHEGQNFSDNFSMSPADPEYHAARIYESVGFRPAQVEHGVYWWDRNRQ